MRSPATDQDRGRYSARRNSKAILRLLRSEDIDVVSYELGVTAASVAGWRDRFVAGGQPALTTRQPDARDEEVMRLKAKIGDLAMENELLNEEARRLKQNLPLPSRRLRT